MMRITQTVKILLIINVLVAILDLFLPAMSFQELFGLRHWASSNFEPYQLLTHFFVHSSLNIQPTHLIFNMITLYMFGSTMEQTWGAKRFILFYLICGVGASIMFSIINYVEMWQLKSTIDEFITSADPYLFEQIMKENLHQRGFTEMLSYIEQFKEQPTNIELVKNSKSLLFELLNMKLSNSVMVGASGAISGLLVAFGMTYPDHRIMLLIPPIPMKAKYMVILFILFDMYRAWQNATDDNVAHFAHLGGALVGFILVKIWRSRRLIP